MIGRRRFLYDLWGDTVNMASRMESHGTPDAIQITRSTWELLRDDFVVEPLGLVDVKGKGAVETWRLVGPRALRALLLTGHWRHSRRAVRRARSGG